MSVATLSPAQICGQLLVCGFDGHELPAELARALGRGERAGVIVFRRNLVELGQTAELCASAASAAPAELPIFVGVDEEGGRVSRLPKPALHLPAMRRLGELDDEALTERAGHAVGAELATLGFNVDFAPVLDVDSNPANPVIGDRSFGATAPSVARHGLAFARGLQGAGVMACGKHFPGHGDTSRDSHRELPEVAHGLERLRTVELKPFAAAAQAGMAALMSAHVVFPALDASAPATLSRRISTDLLRAELGFEGVLFSDDMEMGALSGFGDPAGLVVRAVTAGCDALLLCHDERLQGRAHAALVERFGADDRFAERCRQAAERSLAARRGCPSRWAGGAGRERAQQHQGIGRTAQELDEREAAAVLAALAAGRQGAQAGA